MIMVNDVETVLTEIRERVMAESKALAPATVRQDQVAVGNNNEQHSQTNHNAALDRLSVQLGVTARAWDRLPPVISNRRGALSRLEISIKKLFRPLTRWFTWEQVNFNAAVHHALLDALKLLRAQDQELVALRSAIAHQSEKVERDLEAQSSQMRSLAASRDDFRAGLASIDEMMGGLAEEMRTGHANLTGEMQRRFPEMASDLEAGLKRLAQDFDVRLAEISADLREEQRVCFKQLSLETSEAAVLEDRGRRALESRVARLETVSSDSK